MKATVKEEYRVRLENVFEGPMDLLIHLIRKNEVDIYNIPVALITEQYLAYLEWMQLLDIDNVGDFLLMASTLLHIKSRLLLPTPAPEEEAEDPRLEIVRPLAEYLRIKSAAEELGKRNLLGDQVFTRRVGPQQFADSDEPEAIQIGLFELIDAFQRLLQKASKEHKIDLNIERISVRERMNAIIDELEAKGSLSFLELFATNPSRVEIIVSFLALLELMKLNLVRAVQSPESGVIRLFYQ